MIFAKTPSLPSIPSRWIRYALTTLVLLNVPCTLNAEEAIALSASSPWGPITSETMPEGGIRDQFELFSPSMGRAIPVVVLRPSEEKKEEKPLPALYALHGRNAPMKTFSEMPPLREYLAEHPMLLVSFQADKDSAYIDATERPASKFTTFFFDELVPAIEKHYGASGERAVTGFSMGGYGALHYVAERPEAFTSASALSGAFELFEIIPDTEKWNEWTGSLLGAPESHAEEYRKVAIAPRLEKIIQEGGHLPPLLILCGTEDHLLDGNRRFNDFLGKLGKSDSSGNTSGDSTANAQIDHDYRESPGAHDFKYWKEHAREVAEFHWSHFTHPN